MDKTEPQHPNSSRVKGSELSHFILNCMKYLVNLIRRQLCVELSFYNGVTRIRSS